MWTPPPGLDEWQAGLDSVQPGRLVLFGVQAEAQSLTDFLAQLAGLVKYALNRKDGQFTAGELAAATAQREATVQAALEFLAAQGAFDLSGVAWLTIPAEAEARQQLLESAKQRLQALYQETISYRRYWLAQRF